MPIIEKVRPIHKSMIFRKGKPLFAWAKENMDNVVEAYYEGRGEQDQMNITTGL